MKVSLWTGLIYQVAVGTLQLQGYVFFFFLATLTERYICCSHCVLYSPNMHVILP